MRKIASVLLVMLAVLISLPQAFAVEDNTTINETDDEVDVEMPLAPDNLVASTISEYEIDLLWDLSESDDVDGYNIYQSLSEEFDFSSAYATVDESDNDFDDTGLEQNTTYYYVVRAFDNSSNEENNTNVVFATTLVAGDDDDDDVNDEDNETNETDDEVSDDDDDTDEETENETAAMTDHYGAKMRLLQLERAIDRNIERGNEVIERAEELGLDTDELELIIAELEELKSEVQAADPEADDAVEVFVDLKKDAIELTQEFRKVARELFSDSEAEQIRNRIRQMEHKINKALDDQIKEQQRLHNAEKLKNALEKLGFDDANDMADSIGNGNMTMEQALERIREHVTTMNVSEKKNAYSEMKKENAKAAVKTKAKLDDVQVSALERQEERIQNRLESVQIRANNTNNSRIADAFDDYAERRMAQIQNKSDKIQERITDREEKMDQIRDRINNTQTPPDNQQTPSDARRW